jgi:hypothetical protein
MRSVLRLSVYMQIQCSLPEVHGLLSVFGVGTLKCLRARALSFVVSTVAMLAGLNGCSTAESCAGEQQGTSDRSSCDGTVLVERYESCQMGRYGQGDSRDDCATKRQVCVILSDFYAECAAPCTIDADCPATEYCSSFYRSTHGEGSPAVRPQLVTLGRGTPRALSSTLARSVYETPRRRR